MDDSLAAARAQMIATRFGGNSKGAATGGSGKHFYLEHIVRIITRTTYFMLGSVRRKNKGPIKAVGGE